MRELLQVMTEEEYFADPCEEPSLSQSIAHKLLTRSPYHAWLEHPKLGKARGEPTKDMEEGTILHSLLLGTKPKVAWMPEEFNDYRTKAAQNARDEARFNGLIPMLAKEEKKYSSMASAIQQQLYSFGIELNGQSEGVVLWQVQDNKGREVHCRAMIDHIKDNVIYDLKKTSCAHPSACVRSIIEYGYDIQAAAYLEAIGKKFPDMAGRVKFKNLFFETEYPYLACEITQDESMLTLGRTKWTRAINIWSECLRSGHWPAYGKSTVSAPAWAITKEMEAEQLGVINV